MESLKDTIRELTKKRLANSTVPQSVLNLLLGQTKLEPILIYIKILLFNWNIFQGIYQIIPE
jgi:hypothetical protein